MPSSLDSRHPTGPDPHPMFALQSRRSARVHLPFASTEMLTRSHWALLALNDPCFCALSPEAAAVVLRKCRARVGRKLRNASER